ncbi:hypothetical protein [Bradyrhizobium diazoefficiens]|uniref:hypothetical protein n=1 Tax=Bradyrhizobium diazoefficiens TaxID=1355477 RepID=UPI00272D7C3B|nr:hypothetical protein [Bradyrhizobium diazoefficiens]WLA68560.1 hypothetical protein QNN01_19000 [Bradyrhizobium diazoefficiens]
MIRMPLAPLSDSHNNNVRETAPRRVYTLAAVALTTRTAATIAGTQLVAVYPYPELARSGGKALHFAEADAALTALVLGIVQQVFCHMGYSQVGYLEDGQERSLGFLFASLVTGKCSFRTDH